MRASNLDRDAIAPIVGIVVKVTEFLAADFDVYVYIAGQPQRICNVLKPHCGESHIGRALIELNLTVGREQIAAHAEDLEIAFV